MWAVSDGLTSKPGTPRGPGKPLAPGFPWISKRQSNECVKVDVVFTYYICCQQQKHNGCKEGSQSTILLQTGIDQPLLGLP